MSNEEIAARLEEVADLLELDSHSNRYRVTAYREAASTLRQLGEPIADLFRRVRRESTYVYDRLKLFNGDRAIFEAVRAKQINLSIAKELNRIDDPAFRKMYLETAVRGGCTARVAQEWRVHYEIHHKGRPVPATEETPVEHPSATAPAPLACFLCGGHRDPWNLVSVQVHKHELERIHKMMERLAREE